MWYDTHNIDKEETLKYRQFYKISVSEVWSLLKTSLFVQIALGAEPRLADGQTFKL
jgi:hypothetical protein